MFVPCTQLTAPVSDVNVMCSVREALRSHLSGVDCLKLKDTSFQKSCMMMSVNCRNLSWSVKSTQTWCRNEQKWFRHVQQADKWPFHIPEMNLMQWDKCQACVKMESGPLQLKIHFQVHNLNISYNTFVLSQQCGCLAGTTQCWWGFAPQLFALQADGLSHHQSRGREVMGSSLLLMSAVDVTGDEEGYLPDLLTKQSQMWCVCVHTIFMYELLWIHFNSQSKVCWFVVWSRQYNYITIIIRMNNYHNYVSISI